MLSDLGEPRAVRTSVSPVFVDRTGRRRRFSLFAGVGIGVGLLASLGLILAGLFTGSSVPVPGWPDAQLERQGDPTPTPSRSTPGSVTATPTGAATTPTTSTPTDVPASRGPTAGTGGQRPSSPLPPGQSDDRRNGRGPTKPPGKPR